MTRRRARAAHPIPDAALDQPLAIVGSVGSGKTYAAKGAVEALLAAGRRVLIVDPTGVWWGLRTRADGTPGFPVVIFGGEQADVPVNHEAGDALGRLLAEDRAPQAILDVSEMGSGERTQFLTAVLERVYVGQRVPRHLILDEADEMAPQDPLPETRRLLGIVDRIVRRGRVRGFRPLMITQRPAAIHKNVLSQIATLVALRLSSPQDRKAIEGWVKGSADVNEARPVLASLSGLDVGEGWVWAPREGILARARFPAIGTYDSSATPDHAQPLPRAGQVAAVDVAAIRAALVSGSPASEAASPTRPSAGADAKAIAAAERQGYEAGYQAGHRDAAAWIGPRLQAFSDQVRKLGAAIDAEISEAHRRWGDRREEPVTAPTSAEPSAESATAAGEPGALTPARQRVLDAIAWANATRQPEPSRDVVAFLAGTTASSGGFRNNLGALHTAGLVRYPAKGRVALTAAGGRQARAPDEVLDHAAIMARVRTVLSPTRMRLLDAVVARHPDPVTREDLAEAVDTTATSGGFRNNLGRLSALALVTYPAPGLVRAADILFPDRRTP